MQTFSLQGKDYIQLNQLLKTLTWVNSGGEANIMIDNGEVTVNGKVELRRRNKIKPDFVVGFNGQEVKVTA